MTCGKCRIDKEEAHFSPSTWKLKRNGYCRLCQAEYGRQWLMRHPEYKKNKSKYSSQYDKKRRALDINFRIRKQLRERLNKALKNKQKSGSAIKDLGCSISEFIKHLEEKFQPGMSWENRHQWHIDHIAPLSSFDLSKKEEFKKACHYSNLQPLWAKDNLRKGDRL